MYIRISTEKIICIISVIHPPKTPLKNPIYRDLFLRPSDPLMPRKRLIIADEAFAEE